MRYKKRGERLEILMRLVVWIISGVIIWVSGALVELLILFQIIIVLFSGKRNRDISHFCQVWNSYVYRFLKYMTFASNQRVFPFADFKAPLEPEDMRVCAHEKQKKKYLGQTRILRRLSLNIQNLFIHQIEFSDIWEYR